MKTCSDLVVRRGWGEPHVACYQIWMNPLNLIWCSLWRGVQRRLHERAATPDFTDPIHSRLQALARANRPARAHTHTGRQRGRGRRKRGVSMQTDGNNSRRSTRHSSQEPGKCLLLNMPSTPRNLRHAVRVASPRKLAGTHDRPTLPPYGRGHLPSNFTSNCGD